MRDPEDATTPLPNAFSEEFLRRFLQEDEPASAAEADVAGPWRVEPAATADGREAFGVWRQGERPDWGDAPAGLFRERSMALLAAAVRPFVGRDPFYELGRERWNGGFPLLRQGEAVGWVELRPAGPEAEVSYNVIAELRGLGVASRALQAFLTWAAQQIGLRRAHLACHTGNLASHRVAEKCGFVLLGQQGEEYRFWRDLDQAERPI